jgi:hypothetical protein
MLVVMGVTLSKIQKNECTKNEKIIFLVGGWYYEHQNTGLVWILNGKFQPVPCFRILDHSKTGHICPILLS